MEMVMQHDKGKRGDRSKARRRAVLAHLATCRPEDLLDFIELPQFTKRWEKLGLDDENDLTELQLTIMLAPQKGDVIPGAGGLRKLRFSPSKWPSGTSGATRVLYVYFEEFGICLLCVIYAKNELATISEAVKQFLRETIKETEAELRRLKAFRIDPT